MRPAILTPAVLAVLAMAPAATQAKPVEVTRFHTADTLARIDHAAIAVTAAPGTDGQTLETRVWLDAVARALSRSGVSSAAAVPGADVAEVRVERRTWQPERARRGPVSVGVGGSTGSYGSGVGLGIGIDLSGKPKERIDTVLAVTIRNRETGEALWEGRATHTVKVGSKEADPAVAADKLAHALFAGFPGKSGDTISVK